MDKKWSETKRRNFKKFWDSEMGKESMQLLEELRDMKLDRALHATVNPQYLTEQVTQASGIDEAIQYIVSLTK